jgi:HSP20 family protein
MMFGMIPFERNDGMFDVFDNFERNFFGSSGKSLPDFRTDIRDNGDAFLLEAELPGFEKEDIHLDLKDGVLTITATHKEETEDKKNSYVRRERKYGSFSRAFDVSGIDEAGVRAAYQNGVLTLTLPKAKPVVPEAKRIEIM